MTRRRFTAAALAVVTASCAGSSPPSPDEMPPPAQRMVVYVSPTGSDDGAGTESSPFRTIQRALGVALATEIALAGGTYDENVVLTRPLALLGPEEGGAVLGGHLRIAGRGAVASRLEVNEGVEIDQASHVVLDGLRVKAGEREHALSITAATAQLSDLELTCGKETCVDVRSSTVSAKALHLSGDASAKRGLRAETSSVSLFGITVRGTNINQIQAGQGARVTVTDAELTGALGAGLVAVQGARLDADRVKVSEAARHSVLLQDSRASVRHATLGRSSGTTIGIAGAEVELIEPTSEPAVEAVVSVNQYRDRIPIVRIVGGTLRHASTSAILMGQGDLTVVGTRFVGDAASKSSGDAIVANGASSVVHILGAFIETPAGFGVSLTNDASGTVTASISRPRDGGVFVENVAVAPVVITGGMVERCGTASGIVALSSTDISVVGTRVSGCAEGGVLAGQRAVVHVARAALADNAQYGVAAFGGSSIEVESSRISGSRWATFATCGDGSSIQDAGGNKIAGALASCP